MLIQVFDAQRGVVMKAKRAIRQGEELLYTYGADLCKERALLVYACLGTDIYR